MTSNDLNNWKMFQLWLYAYQTKARNPGHRAHAENGPSEFKSNT